MYYEAKTFNIPELEGISKESIDMHIGLYNGYVKNVNLIHDKIEAFCNDMDNNIIAISEMQRRFGFEFGGMRNHEYYFSQFEEGAKPMKPDCKLKAKIEKQWGSFENWQNKFTTIAMTRGVGWAMLYFDPKTDQLVQTWVDEQHQGQLPDLNIVLALDMWEHSFLRDYMPAEKKKYVEAFFKNLNWEIISKRI